MPLKVLLDDHNLSNYQLSTLTLIPLETINMWTDGTRDPLEMPLHSARTISRLLNLSLDDFYETLKSFQL